MSTAYLNASLRNSVAGLLGMAAILSVRADVPASQPATTTNPVELEPAHLRGLTDEGVFHLYKDEEQLATIRYKLSADGRVESESILAIAGQTVESGMRIEPDAEGRWRRIELKTSLGPAEVTRSGDEITTNGPSGVRTMKGKADALIFENFTPVLISQAILHYDQQKGGEQSFPIFFVPAAVLSGSVERLDSVNRRVGDRDWTFVRYKYALPGVDVTVWADAEGRLYLGDVPQQRAAYVREGFESLRVEEADEALLSKPDHEVRRESNVRVAMRDGVELAMDLYIPQTPGKHPTILVRTPYKKEMSELQAMFFGRRGYVVAIQDCRGRFGSSGTWTPFMHEAEDGYDTIEWLAAQPWSDGKIGMIGASYLGWAQWWAASENPPHLTTIIPQVSPPDPFYNIPYEYGAFFLWGAIWWADVLESEATADLSGGAMSRIGEKNYSKLLRALPVIDLDLAVLGKENPYWRSWIEHPTNDEFWAPASFHDKLSHVRIPVFHQSGWFDGDGIGSKLNYLRMVSHGNPNQKLVLGPWGHSPEAHRMIGMRDFGPNAIIDLPRDYLRWMDRWLKGVDNGIERDPLVSLFAMGSNVWLHGDRYPLPQTEFTALYLASGGKANTSKGDGVLQWERPGADCPPDKYTYDPGDPTPNPEIYEEPDTPKDETRSVDELRAAREAQHELISSSRADILVYQSAAFDQEMTIAGPVSAVLYASTSARDTDWFVRLVEVDEKGGLFALVEGRLRARFRNGMSTPELLEPNRVYEFRLDLWQTGITIAKGRRLRVEVASASFPFFSRNLNTGGHNEKETEFVAAEQTIYHDAERPSHVLLPVIPADFVEAAKKQASVPAKK